MPAWTSPTGIVSIGLETWAGTPKENRKAKILEKSTRLMNLTWNTDSSATKRIYTSRFVPGGRAAKARAVQNIPIAKAYVYTNIRGLPRNSMFSFHWLRNLAPSPGQFLTVPLITLVLVFLPIGSLRLIAQD